MTKRKRKPRQRLDPALMDYIDKLDARDQALICLAVNSHSKNKRNIHRGILPFLRLREVVECCEIASGQVGKRRYASLLDKIEAHKYRPQPRKEVLILNNTRVAKFFGAHPEKGVIFRWLPKKTVTAGLKWSVGDRDYIYDEDVRLHRMIVLTGIPSDQKPPWGKWRLEAEPEHLNFVYAWLLEHCV